MVSLVKNIGRHRAERHGEDASPVFVTIDGCVMRRDGHDVAHVTECQLPDWARAVGFLDAA